MPVTVAISVLPPGRLAIGPMLCRRPLFSSVRCVVTSLLCLRATAVLSDAHAASASAIPLDVVGSWLLFGVIVLLLIALAVGLGVWGLKGVAQDGPSSLLVQRIDSAPQPEKEDERVRRLVALDEKKNRFFADISHELRTPLTLLHGGLEDALDGAFGQVPSPLHQRLEHMREHVNRLRYLTDRLLDLSRLEVTDPDLNPEPRDLAAFLRRLVRAFVPAAERAGVDLDLETTPDAHPCRFDPGKLQKVFGNLVSNALKFTPAGGEVTVFLTVEASREEGPAPDAVVEVTDTGRGIPDDRQDEVFERFSSFHPHGKNQPGTGLGLALAHEFTELHDGTISLESTPGRGSTFTVRLPLPTADANEGRKALPERNTPPGRAVAPVLVREEPPEEDVAPSGDGSSDLDRPLLLLVDDNAEVRAYLRRHLSSLGSVIESPDGTDGLATVRDAAPDLVLANVVMPELDGLALTRRIRADDDLDRMPILLLTARATAEDAVEGLEAGADDYVRKPFSIDELRARVEQLLAARQAWATTETRDDRLLAPEVDATPADEAFLERVTDVIDENLARVGFTVEDLAAGVGVSPRHLQRKVKQLTGCPAGEFVRRYRLECAAELLASDAGSVSEIAYSVGFGTPKTFARHFKKHFDCTPSTYAERHDE